MFHQNNMKVILQKKIIIESKDRLIFFMKNCKKRERERKKNEIYIKKMKQQESNFTEIIYI